MIKKRTAKDGTVSFQVYSRVSGKKAYVGTFPSEKVAKENLQDHEVRARAVERGELPPESDDKRTLERALKEWMSSLEKQKSRSAETYQSRLDTYIIPALGNVPVERIRQHHVMALRDGLAPKVSARTANGAVVTLSAAFEHFIKRQWVATNPCHGVEALEAKQHPFVWLHTSAEISKVIEACGPSFRDLIAMAFGTGMRIDELLCLRWDDIDLPARLICVHRGRKGPTKGGKMRYVPILDAILPMLRQRALQRGENALVFPNPEGRIRSQVNVREGFKRALRKAGMDTALRVHDARHTFASHWVANGGDLWLLSKVLGHGSVTITERFYAHLRPEAFVTEYQRVRFVAPGAPVAEVVPLRTVG